MALKFPNGAQFGFSTVLGVAKAVTTVSNANPAVASGVPAGSFVEDDVLIVLSSNPLINNIATQAGTVTPGAESPITTQSLQLLGVDTSDTALYDLAGAVTTLYKASTFVDFTQQGDPSTSGGEQQYWSGTFLEDPTGQQISVPTFKNAKVLTIPLYFDKSLSWYAAARAADIKKLPIVLRCQLPDGDTIYRYGYLSFDADPSMSANNPMGNNATFTALGQSILVSA